MTAAGAPFRRAQQSALRGVELACRLRGRCGGNRHCALIATLARELVITMFIPCSIQLRFTTVFGAISGIAGG